MKANNYKIVALTDFDFIYNVEEKIAFSNALDSMLKKIVLFHLFAFDPIVKIDSVTPDTLAIKPF